MWVAAVATAAPLVVAFADGVTAGKKKKCIHRASFGRLANESTERLYWLLFLGNALYS
jgi:hypothetical protein